MTIDGTDGINGTDNNVSVLFPEKPSAAGLPPQPEVVKILEEFAVEAACGNITGLMIIGINETGHIRAAVSGKVPFRDGVSALEQMKFGILARDYAHNIQNWQK